MSEYIFSMAGQTSSLKIKGTEQTDYELDLDSIQLSTNIIPTKLTWAGGSSSHVFSVPGLTSASIINCEIAASTNSVIISSRKVLANDQLTVTFSADPGAVTLDLIAFIAPQ